MHDVIYLIVSPQKVARMAHSLEGIVYSNELPLRIVVNVPDTYFAKRDLPGLRLSLPQPDMLTHAGVEVTATPILPESEPA